MVSEVQEMRERLEGVEKSMRRYRAALAAATVAASVGLLAPWPLGAGKALEKISAKRFEVIDDAGQTRASLSADSIGPSLDLYDQGGRLRASLRVTGHGSFLALSDPARRLRAGLSANSDSSGLDLYDQAGRLRAELAAGGDGPNLARYDHAGKTQAQPRTTQLKVKSTGSTKRRTQSSLVLLSKKGKVLWEAP